MIVEFDGEFLEFGGKVVMRRGEEGMGIEKLEVGLGRKSVVLAGHVASLFQDERLVGGLKEWSLKWDSGEGRTG